LDIFLPFYYWRKKSGAVDIVYLDKPAVNFVSRTHTYTHTHTRTHTHTQFDEQNGPKDRLDVIAVFWPVNRRIFR